jgi:hypothetical protein
MISGNGMLQGSAAAAACGARRSFAAQLTSARRLATAAVLASGMLLGNICVAGSAPPEKWLPDDTYGFVAVRDVKTATALVKNTPRGRLWLDSAMKPFRDKMLENFKRDFLTPLERELHFEFKSFVGLLEGPATLAVLQGDLADRNDTAAGWLFVGETGSNSPEMTKELARLQSIWASSGKRLRHVSVREHEFVAISFDTNGPLGRVRRFLPKALDFQELGRRTILTNGAPARELYIGQYGSLLILSASHKGLEKVVHRMAGAAAPVLGEQAAYESCHKRLFMDAPVYGWINARAGLARYAPPTVRDTAEPPPTLVDVLDKEKLVKVSGLGALRSIGLGLIQSPEGLRLEAFFNVPNAERDGLFRILSGEPKPWDVPGLVPGDVAEFSRWRVDGPGGWATLEKVLADISPRWLSTINFIIDTANQHANLTDPGFDVRRSLVANLGDDFISYSKAPQNGVQPSLLMISSPKPVEFAAALQRILIFMTAEAENPAQRDFLGRKIYSVPLPAVPLPLGETPPQGANRVLHYSATSSYVLLSTDVALLEEQLRSSEATAGSLKDTPGLREAASRVGGSGTRMFSYRDTRLLEKARFEAMQKASGAAKTNALLQLDSLSWAGIVAPEQGLQQWMDFGLLPQFERLSKYFHFTVRSINSSSDGVSILWFYPTPPLLRGENPV